MSQQKYQLNQVSLSNVSFDIVSTIQGPEKYEIKTSFIPSVSIIKDNFYLVSLKVIVDLRDLSKNNDFSNASVTYDGVFEISGFETKDDLDKVIMAYCLSALFPFCRSKIVSIYAETPFKNIMLPMIDFFAIHEANKNNK